MGTPHTSDTTNTNLKIMNTLDLSTQTLIQLAKLEAEEQQNIKNISNILTKVDKLCQEEAGMSLDELIDNYDNCIERLEVINNEQQYRIKVEQ